MFITLFFMFRFSFSSSGIIPPASTVYIRNYRMGSLGQNGNGSPGHGGQVGP